MTVYIDVVMLLNFVVDFLLLAGADMLCGYPPRWIRTVSAAFIGGIYGGACLLPQVRFLGNTFWRVVSLCLISWIAFGFHKSALRRGIVFVLLSMALGGISLGLGNGGFWTLAGAAAVVAVMCVVGFRGRIGVASYVPVELLHDGKKIHFTALCDTGNALRDPLTGRSVLVVGSEIALQLTGLTPQQLKSPSEAILTAGLPGLRLIPYCAVGQPGSLLLGMRVQNARIGKWRGSAVVAFAPEKLNADGAYQALTGGVI